MVVSLAGDSEGGRGDQRRGRSQVGRVGWSRWREGGLAWRQTQTKQRGKFGYVLLKNFKVRYILLLSHHLQFRVSIINRKPKTETEKISSLFDSRNHRTEVIEKNLVPTLG